MGPCCRRSTSLGTLPPYGPDVFLRQHLGRVSQRGHDVFSGEVIFRHQILVRHSTSKFAEDQINGNPRSLDYGFAEKNTFVNDDSMRNFLCFTFCLSADGGFLPGLFLPYP